MLYTLIVIFILVGIYLLTNQKMAIKVAGGVTALLGVLILDYTDFFSNLGILKHININNYIELVAAIIGGIIAFYIAKYQIEKTNEENKNNEKESLRIQNMPILKYEIDTNNKTNNGSREMLLTNINSDKKGINYINISAENIGNTIVRNIKMYIYSDALALKYQSLIDNNSIYPLKSEETININNYMDLELGGKYEFNYVIYYQDILLNWYKQQITVKYDALSICYRLSDATVSYKIEEETLIDSDTLNNETKKIEEAQSTKR